MPLVSIIIPFHNQIELVPKCLTSVISETLRDIEIIVVDDGSKEDASALIEIFQDMRIRLIREMNAGVAQAPNNAIAKSSGKFPVFLDVDDWLAPSMVEELVEPLSHSNKYDFAYCDVTRVGPFGEKPDDISISSSRPQLSRDILPSPITGGYFPPASVPVRASVIAGCGGFEPALGGCCDWDL